MKTRRYLATGLLGALILTLGTLPLQAQEDRPAPPPPQKESPPPAADAPEGMRVERIRQRIKDLHAAGKHEEANQLAERLRQAHMKMGDRRMADRMPRGKADKVPGEKAAKKADRKAGAKHPEGKRPMPPMGPPPIMKIRNLTMASKLLDAAGYPEYAGKARQEASRIEGEIRKMAEAKKREHEMRRDQEAKRREMEKREAENPKDRPDPAADMREEMKKLRRELEELRGQLKKAKAEADSRPETGPREEDRPR